MSGVVTQHESNLVTLGSFRDPSVALTLVGLVITIRADRSQCAGSDIHRNDRDCHNRFLYRPIGN